MVGLLDLANKNIQHPVKFEFQITKLFEDKYIPNIAWGILVLKIIYYLSEIQIDLTFLIFYGTTQGVSSG